MRRLFLQFLFLFIPLCGFAGDYWQQDVNCRIEVELLPAEHSIVGNLELQYTNNSPHTLKYLYLRLAPNAMRPGSPAHLRELSFGNNRFADVDTTEYGLCLIHSIEEQSTGPLNFEIDYSLARIELDEPLVPGETRTFVLEFTTRLPSPRLAYRFAFIRGQFKAAHWYPQICVYDRILGWVNNQYLGWGENYGEIGTYSVAITAPSDYIVAASGVLMNREQVLPDTLRKLLERKNFVDGVDRPDLSFMKGGEAKTWEFCGENISDFAFNADPEFCLDEAEYEGLKIYAYIRRNNADEWYDAAETGKRGIQFYCENFGRYSYPQMSITDAWGGMEFPMLVMCSGSSPEYYLLFWHEIAHNYFMGAVATNQTDRAFLDEGFTTFLELAAMENFLGREDNLALRTTWYTRNFHPFDEDRIYRGFRPYMLPAMQGYTVPMPMNADSAPEWWIYRASSYYKPVCMLFALEYMLGREELFRCIREYHRNWRFKHPYEADMFDSFEQSSGQELTYFFEQWVYTDKKLDYAISAVNKIPPESGNYRYRIRLERPGDMVIPIGFTVKLKNGETLKYWIPLNDNPPPPDADEILPCWDQLRNPQSTYITEISLPYEIRWIDLDPEGLLADLNPLNNCYPFPKVRFDWLTAAYSPPVNAYQIRQRPDLGYNIVDGLEPGWKLKGSYLEYRHQFELSAKMGLLTYEPDVSAEYQTPIQSVSPRAFIKIGGFYTNGWRGGDFGFKWLNQPRYRYPPEGGLELAFRHRRHFDDRYLPLPEIWSEGDDNTIYMRYWRNLSYTGNVRMEITGASSFLTADFAYSALEWRLHQRQHLGSGFSFDFRLGAGILKGDRIPGQKLFYSNGWDPEIDRGYEFWGTRSLVPDADAAHFFTRSRPGLYSEYDIITGAESYAAFSSELTLPPALSRRIWLPFIENLRPALNLILFANLIFDTENLYPANEYLWEAGPGLKLSGLPGGDFRLVFPFWVDPAPLESDNYDYRWVAVFTPNFEF